MKISKELNSDVYDKLLSEILNIQPPKLAKSWTTKIVYITVSIISIIFSVFLCFMVYKNNFTVESVLSVLLAFFSIFISIIFYFKADEASARFYDNSYNFMKDVSVTLGKIEERFGEKLNSMNEKLAHMESIKTETKQELAVAEDEKDKIINELVSKAKLSQAESEKYKNELRKKFEETELLKEKLYNIDRSNRELFMMSRNRSNFSRDSLIKRFISELTNSDKINLLRGRQARECNENSIRIGIEAGIIDERGHITEFGKNLLKMDINYEENMNT